MADRALTVRQPYADLEIAGVKPVENRTKPVPSTLPQRWRCEVCGERKCADDCGWADWVADGPFPFRLWIHAGRAKTHAPAYVREAWSALSNPRDNGQWLGQLGVLLGSVTVSGQHHAAERRCTCWSCAGGLGECETNGLCDRFAEPDRWHIILDDPQPLATPIPCRGQLGFWRLTDDLRAAIAEQTEAADG